MKLIKNTNTNEQLQSTNNLREIADDVENRTSKAIEKGVNNPNASNGTPMDELNGAAELTATLKNIGIESTRNGGMKDGIDTLLKNKSARSIIQTLDLVEKSGFKSKLIEGENEEDD